MEEVISARGELIYGGGSRQHEDHEELLRSAGTQHQSSIKSPERLELRVEDNRVGSESSVWAGQALRLQHVHYLLLPNPVNTHNTL